MMIVYYALILLANSVLYMCMINRSLKSDYLVGKHVQILFMYGEPLYSGRKGIITTIDSVGQIHGTWGGCALIPGTDKWKIIESN